MAKSNKNEFKNSLNNEIYDATNFITNNNSFLRRRMLPPIPLQTSKTNCQTPTLNLNDRITKTSLIWFQPKITKVEVEEILNKSETGIFIIRLNSLNENIVLSFKALNKVSHVKIKINQQKGVHMDGSSNVFKSINELVSYYMLNLIQEPDIKLKFPTILMESFHSNHFKFFENMKLDFWNTNVYQLMLSDIFFDSLIDNNVYPTDINNIYNSTTSLPEKINKDKSRNFWFNKARIVKMNETGESFRIFRKLKSLLNKVPSPVKAQPDISRKQTSLPSTPTLLNNSDHFNFVSGLANDFDDYDN